MSNFKQKQALHRQASLDLFLATVAKKVIWGWCKSSVDCGTIFISA